MTFYLSLQPARDGTWILIYVFIVELKFKIFEKLASQKFQYLIQFFRKQYMIEIRFVSSN